MVSYPIGFVENTFFPCGFGLSLIHWTNCRRVLYASPIGSVFNFNGDSLGANIMTLLALVLLLFGVAYCLIGSVQLLIVMFRESIWWGLAQLLVPATHLLFMCLHFKEAWPPIKKCLVGSLCVVVTLFLPLNGEIVTGFRPNTAPLRELWNSYINDAMRPSHQTVDNGDLSFQTVGDYKGKTLIQGKGEVSRILADDREGSKHQRFILRFASGRTLLVAHNIDVGRRINGIKVGDQVEPASQRPAQRWPLAGGRTLPSGAE